MERIEMVCYFLLGGCLGLSAWKDIRTRTISAWVCLVFGAAGAVLAGVRCFGAGSPEALISAALGTLPALLMLAVSKWTKGALGMGDVMLFGVSGIYLGFTGNLIFIDNSGTVYELTRDSVENYIAMRPLHKKWYEFEYGA